MSGELLIEVVRVSTSLGVMGLSMIRKMSARRAANNIANIKLKQIST